MMFRDVRVTEKGNVGTVVCLETGAQARVAKLPNGMFRLLDLRKNPSKT